MKKLIILIILLFAVLLVYPQEPAPTIMYLTKEKIIALLQYNQKITANEMAEITSLSVRTIKNILAELTNLNIIERHGADKNGIWIIKDKK